MGRGYWGWRAGKLKRFEKSSTGGACSSAGAWLCATLGGGVHERGQRLRVALGHLHALLHHGGRHDGAAGLVHAAELAVGAVREAEHGARQVLLVARGVDQHRVLHHGERRRVRAVLDAQRRGVSVCNRWHQQQNKAQKKCRRENRESSEKNPLQRLERRHDGRERRIQHVAVVVHAVHVHHELPGRLALDDAQVLHLHDARAAAANNNTSTTVRTPPSPGHCAIAAASIPDDDSRELAADALRLLRRPPHREAARAQRGQVHLDSCSQ
ncbi:hypothetical protein ON010_g18354 [Phytophthora cinnamomi]|nr:hypothetical protein ON010_g18354 [Phytophthora cinnamomi]